MQSIGVSTVEPRTYFFWSREHNSTVEVTDLGSNRFLVRSCKAFRLLKQDRDTYESHVRSLSELNDYLSDNFPDFRLMVDFVDRVDKKYLKDASDLDVTADRVESLLAEKQSLEKEIENLQQSIEIGLEDFKNHLEDKLIHKQQRLENVEGELDKIKDGLDRKKREFSEWERNGVLLSYIFQVSTDPVIATADNLEEVVGQCLEDIVGKHKYSIKSRLRKERFRLQVESVDKPRVFNRFEHTMLLNPNNFQQLKENHPELENQLEKLRESSLKNFQAYASKDLVTKEATFERRKQTPAKAVQSILKDLEKTNLSTTDPTEIPNDGPMVGTLLNSHQVVGFDIFDYGPHYMISGKTSTGKTHLKRVFIENAASQNYNILTISPTKRTSLGLGFPNKDNENGTALDFDHYWFGNNKLLDKPGDLTELFHGRNAVTMYGYSNRQQFIDSLFTRLDQYSFDSELFVFLDESHRFNTGDAAESIQTIAQEGRSHGIRLVLVSQNPKTFQHQYKEVRNNTSYILFNNSYPDDILRLVDDSGQISNFNQGQCVFANFLELPEISIDTRDTLTRMWKGTPSESEINSLEQRFEKQIPFQTGSSGQTPTQDTNSSQETTSQKQDLSSTGVEGDEKQLLEFIKDYIQENDEAPTYSKCFRHSDSPFGASKTQNLLEEMVEKDVLKKRDVVRGGNETEAYLPR